MKITPRTESFRITLKQYNYLLPVWPRGDSPLLKRCIDGGKEEHAFIGTVEEYADAQRRCAYIDD